MHISKLEAARRQLEAAIRLFFLNGDPVAIHTLTGAARGLLGDLSHAEGKKGLLDTYFFPYVRPEIAPLTPSQRLRRLARRAARLGLDRRQA